MDKYPIILVCQTLKISKSTYYERKLVPQTDKEKEIIELGAKAKEVFDENKKEYGRTRLCKALRAKGEKLGETKTGRIMRQFGIVPKTIKKYKATTNSKHSYEVAENLLNREFEQEKPNKVWCGDSTFVPTDEGWLYVAGIIDLCDKTCVGLAFSERHTRQLMIEALDSAKNTYRPKAGLMFHSDRGVQYASNDYKDRLKKYGMIQSMSRSGNPYDNAAMESFWATVKKIVVNGVRFRTKREAIKAIFEYVQGFYNTRRYHTAINNMTPLEYRKQLLKAS